MERENKYFILSKRNKWKSSLRFYFLSVNKHCSLLLHYNVLAGNKVTLSFLSFELEQSEFCNADYLEVRSDASNGTLQGVFCGDEIPNNITASNALWLRFRSDSINTAKGFMAKYTLGLLPCLTSFFLIL